MITQVLTAAVDRATELLLTYAYGAGPGVGLAVAPLLAGYLVGEHRRYRLDRRAWVVASRGRVAR